LDIHPYLYQPYPIKSSERATILNRYELLLQRLSEFSNNTDDINSQDNDRLDQPPLCKSSLDKPSLCKSSLDKPLLGKHFLDKHSLEKHKRDRAIENKLQSLKDFSNRLSESEVDIANSTATVCLGPVTLNQVRFQYSTLPSEKRDVETCIPVCAAINKLSNVHYGSMESDLATWIFALSSQTVREYYLLTLLQTYLMVLTNTLELLGVQAHKLDISFNEFASRFFEQVPFAVLSAVLMTLQTVSDADIESLSPEVTEPSSVILQGPLSSERNLPNSRAEFYSHFIDDVKKFM